MKGLAIGQTARTRRTFSAADIAGYRVLSGDAGLTYGMHQILIDKDRVPGPLIGGLFSFLLGTRLPGPGTNWLKQRVSFPNPAYLGEELTAEVEIVRLRPEKALVNLLTLCKNPAGEIVCEGEALVLVADLQDVSPH